ncbi:YgcG family protein [Methylomonas sp. MO1]|uniref:TPM domain-containing protein n=1 Tax=Methylomonas sp. MO1 TaxID=3073619 RepID=UPI0028A53455|nr:YgcG family protein [Methylomonas sp. MO1]MDT4291549.1 YgcG family protein [Methylomonas sp. MO1]
MSAAFPGFVAAVLLVWCLFAKAVIAEQAVPNLEQRVTDLTATLSAQQKTTLEQRLQAFEQQKGSQIAILIVASTQPEDIAQYAIRVVEQWRLGRKGVDDGILMLLAKDDRATRIEVGYGLEGVVPDVLAKRIIDDIMIPYFRQGDYAAGINAGIDSLIGIFDGVPLPAPQASFVDGRVQRLLPLLVFLAVAGGWILRTLFGSFLGGIINGSVVGILAWLLNAGWLVACLAAFFAFMVSLSNGRRAFRGRQNDNFNDDDDFGGGPGGGFSGGGGGFGGGGASGRW